MDLNIFQWMKEIIKIEDNEIQKKVFWIISNLMAGGEVQINSAIKHNIFEKIFENIEEKNSNVKKFF